jgi:TPR repeat protein
MMPSLLDFKLAADQNNASFQNCYAICLATGSVVKDEAEAAQYYRVSHSGSVTRFMIDIGEK